ncbi:MAG: response regulator [Desulfococcaceae bacterium]|jgi:CheY-like chemotaxis protein|nr:response regulator [Desulfococcaceae bacterium]
METAENLPDKAKILIVDDTLENLQLLAEMLNRRGYAVTGAPDGPTARMIAENEPPDLILLDIMMPETDGYAVCRQLKSSPQTASVPVIFLSALEDTQNKIKGFQAGGVDFITKPFQTEEVSARIETHLKLRGFQKKLEEQNRRLETEIRARCRAEEKLKKYSGELEKLVAERTAELRKEHCLKVELQQQLQRTQRMEALGTLAGGIAHDFNNILFPILGYAEMMRDDLPEDSGLQEYLKQILQGIDRAVQLVRQILTFCRRSDHKIEPLQIHLIVKEVLKLMRASLPSTIEIRQHVKDCGMVLADPSHIHQMLMNLISNAFHAMEETGGCLTVALEDIHLLPEEICGEEMLPGDYIRLRVADTGSGMDSLTEEHIYDPYFTTKEQGKGTGLGLSVVHGIVKSCKGHIRVDTAPGKGTEFTIYLPQAYAWKPGEKQQKNSDPLPRGNECILIADDEIQILHMLRQMLERLGYQVSAHRNSADALAVFRAIPQQFDLLITDYTMPHMDGLHLAKQIKSIRPDIPILLCTGYSERVNRETAEASGIKGFMLKPISKKDLAETVRRLLDLHPDSGAGSRKK